MQQTPLGDGWSGRLVSTADVNPANGGPEIFAAEVFCGDRIAFHYRLRDHTDGRPPETTVLDKMEEAIKVIRREALPKQRFWQCACLALNDAERPRCFRCGRLPEQTWAGGFGDPEVDEGIRTRQCLRRAVTT